jgi:polysaccharide export outer membrane protein
MTKTNWKVSLIGIAVLLVAGVSTFVGQNRDTEIISSAGPQTPEESKATLGPGNQPETDRPTLQLRNPRYQLRRGDSFELNFPYAPAFNQNLTVHPDGYITLRGVGDLRVEGRTIPELTQALRTEYSKIFQEPTITVDLKDFEKPYFIASGEVERPGKYELRGDTTVAQAVAIAGGFNERAKHSQVLLFRRLSDDWVEVKQLNMKKMLQAANLREDLHLQPGDMLFVPKTALAKIKAIIPRLSVVPYVRPF